MFRLLNIEFHKLKHNKASKVLSIIYFALLTSIALIAAIKFDIGIVKFHLADQGIFNLPYIFFCMAIGFLQMKKCFTNISVDQRRYFGNIIFCFEEIRG